MDTTHRIRAHFNASAQLKLAAVDALAPQIARASTLMTECLLADGKILACGNGGSASDAQHFAASTAVIALDDREAARTQKLRGESFGGVAAVHCGGA